MKKTTIACMALACIVSLSATAQEMPAPRKMPRVPVKSQSTVQAVESMPASREVQGAATVIDGEKLHIGIYDVRLFGVVPPQLTASFGPQARAELDALANGQSVSCHIRDRDHDGRLLATCRNSANEDMALELLKRGLAVTARGSIAGTELATSYLAAEAAAQAQKIGLWTTAIAAPAAALPAPKAEEAEPAPKTEKVAQRTAATAPEAPLSSAAAQARRDDLVWAQSGDPGFFARYQILIAGFLTLATAFGITAALWIQKSRDRDCEVRALAAALRGELMAARGVCLGRSKAITDTVQDRASSWPRIRATLYQAYVGRLGLLGAELARQVSSIYGQSSDYAAFYSPSSATHDAPKKVALETLVRHIDAVLPKLAEMEQTGRIPAPGFRPRAAAPAPVEATPAETHHAETPTEARAADAAPEPAHPDDHDPSYIPTDQLMATRRTPPALWEAVRDFIQNHRNGVEEPPTPNDPHVAEYAEAIEAEMERYQYNEAAEPVEAVPGKVEQIGKRTPRK